MQESRVTRQGSKGKHEEGKAMVRETNSGEWGNDGIEGRGKEWRIMGDKKRLEEEGVREVKR